MSPEAPLARIGELLSAAGIPYALIGAHAVNAWLEPRFTADIDITAQVDPSAMQRMRAVLEASAGRGSGSFWIC